MKDFFISYNKADESWAEWIAWQLEEAGYSTTVQVWDFAAGGNFVAQMQKAARECHRTVAILSEDYLRASFTQPEWQAAFAKDPTGEKRLLIPIRVRECEPEGLLPQIVYVDLVDIDADQARKRILQHVSDTRSKPKAEPLFPGGTKSNAPVGVQLDEAVYEIPFVIGVLADLSAHSDVLKPALSERNFVEITPDSFEAFLKSCSPRLEFRVKDHLTQVDGSELPIELRFQRLSDFSPSSVAMQVDPLSAIYRRRIALHQLLVRAQAHPQTEQLISNVLLDSELLETLAVIHASAMQAEQSIDSRNNASLTEKRLQALREFRYKLSKIPGMHSQERCLEFERTLSYLVERRFWFQETALDGLRLAVADLDMKLTDQIIPIIQHPEFQRVEATWRGLHRLVNQIGSDRTLRLKAFDIRKDELLWSITSYKSSLDMDRTYEMFGSFLNSKSASESPLFAKLNQELIVLGGNPFGCLIGDYYFDNSSADVALLENMAFLAANLQTPFLAGAAPSIFGLESWAEINNAGQLDHIFALPEYGFWNRFRKENQAKFIGLTLPRFLVRRPHERESLRSNDFVFDEERGWNNLKRLCWCNSAYLLASNIAQSFKNSGWFGNIQGIHSGGLIDGLPVFEFQTDNGEIMLKGPTEGVISDATEVTLRRLGFIPLVPFKNTARAVFFECRSLWDTSEKQSSSASLSSVLIASRIYHYLVCILRDQPRRLETKEEAKDYLVRWISRYVVQDNDSRRLPTRPLKAVEINANDVPDSPGSFTIDLSLQPVYDWGADEPIRLKISYNART